MSNEENIEEIIERALSCPLDCSDCDKTPQECILDVRKCLNLLFRLVLNKEEREELLETSKLFYT